MATEATFPARSLDVSVGAILTGLVLAASAGTPACSTKTCDVHEVDDSVESELLYTEPLAARDARGARLRAGGAATVLLDADRARGTARVVDERRRFDGHVGLSARDGRKTIVLDSLIRTSFELEGIEVWLPVSAITLELDRPTADGRLTLAELHATICETVQQPPAGSSNMSEVCHDAAGVLDFASSADGEAFDADLALAAAQGAADGPSLRGTARVHHAPHVSSHTCLDLGGGGSGSGVFSP